MDRKEEKEIVPSNEAFQFRMALNDNKAGMEGLDKEKINKIIMDATKGSRFYDNELKKDQQVNQRIEKMMQQKALLTSPQIKKAQIQVDKLAMELERRRDLSRVIVHIDMDAFYAAVEMRDNPELKDKPMAVGSMSMLSTSNYLARRYGVRAAMPGFIAKRLCPNLTIVSSNFDKYRAVSKEVREILVDYDPNFLPLSLDEAYLDITDHLEERLSWPEEKRRYFLRKPESEEGCDAGTEEPTAQTEEVQCVSPVLFEDSPGLLFDQNVVISEQSKNEQNGKQLTETMLVFGTSAEEAVREMRFRVEQKTKLTASAGIAPNMLLAKVCSDKNKPNGQYRIPHDRQAVMDFVKDLPIRKVPGIGKVTEKMLKALGIVTCTDLYQQRALLSLLFSEISWHNFINISLGIGSTHIEKDGERKSISTERTFSEISAADEQYSLCQELCRDLAQDIKREGLKGKTVTLKLKNVHFEVKTRASTVMSAVSTEEEIYAVAREILSSEMDLASPEPLRLRLMGVRVSGFLSEEEKKHQQKSIVNFLQAGISPKPESSAMLEQATQNTQAPTPHRTSFFDQKRVARQQKAQEPLTNVHRSKNTAINIVSTLPSEEKKEISVLEQPSQRPGLTCPICFQEKSGWGLEEFNKHIDDCLSKTPVSNSTKISNVEETIMRNNSGLFCIKEERNLDVCKNNIMNKLADTRGCNTLEDCIIENEEVIDNPHHVESNINEYKQTPVNHRSITLNEADMRNAYEHELFSKQCCDVANQPYSPAVLEEPIFICPVCNVKQDTRDLLVFNRHVDICLNEGTIRELKDETAASKKKNEIQGNPQNNGSSGKSKSANTSGRTKRSGAASQNPVSKKAKTSSSTNTIDRFFK
ncbi:DNA polymerase kappa isoform X2 [Bombina bombina]|uniref:DNA polymerase kappa isoform X2 n=1 Tax=Bombina bombina TaxID=8345 RepID=UPI00235A4E6C|nr:DNA polymerase kappa isoform X2 [Bombina bombina]